MRLNSECRPYLNADFISKYFWTRFVSNKWHRIETIKCIYRYWNSIEKFQYVNGIADARKSDINGWSKFSYK